MKRRPSPRSSSRPARPLPAVLAAALTLALTALAPPPGAGAAEPEGELDGQTFRVTVGKKGEGDGDTLIFDKARFLSSDASGLGFGWSTYATSSTKDGEGTKFFATVANADEAEGEYVWKGVVRGESIEGVRLWRVPGTPDVERWFRGTRQR